MARRTRLDRFMRSNLAPLLAALALCSGCHNTAQGVKEDTKRALDKTGDALHKAADKIDGSKDARDGG